MAGLVVFACLLAGCGYEDADSVSVPAEDLLRTKSSTRQNVVVIVIDTLRPDHLGFLGHHRETAPYLASLAEKSVVFTRAVSTSTWTAPSTASLFTGLHPLRHGIQLGIVAHRKRMGNEEATGTAMLQLNRMPESISTLPELFRDLGYRTFGIATNPNIGSSIGFDRGFDRFKLLDSRSLSADEARAAGHPRKRFRWANIEELYEELGRWKADLVAVPEPFFLYLHINDVHGPYDQHAPFYRAPEGQDGGQALYDSEIGYVDDVLARIHADLNFDDDTIIVFVSDHGEAFGEHGYVAHREGVYGEVNRILMMLSAPSLGVEASRVKSRVSIMAVLPTLLELVGASTPADLQGLSLVPLLQFEGERASHAREDLERQLKERVLVVHRVAQNPEDPAVSWAVMKGRWKLIHDRTRVELYDVEMDLEERHDLVLEHPEVRESLEARLEEFREQTRLIDSQSVDLLLDPETIEALREIGYGE